jgi:hypothetical protein
VSFTGPADVESSIMQEEDEEEEEEETLDECGRIK